VLSAILDISGKDAEKEILMIGQRFAWWLPVTIALLAAPISPWGRGPNTPAIAWAAGSPVVAAATAPSSIGPISVVVSSVTAAGGKLDLLVSAGKFTYQFQIPASDFTQKGHTATLNTRGDLKGFGSIQLTWTKQVATLPNASGSCVPVGTQKVVYYTNARGHATLKLPCLKALAPYFGAPVKLRAALPATPQIGVFSGVIATVTVIVKDNNSVSLTLARSTDPTKKVNLFGLVSKQVSGSGPLVTQTQLFHTTFPTSRMQVQSDLSVVSADLSAGPHPVKGTALHWTSSQAPAATQVTTADCKVKTGTGASRTSSAQGTVGLQTCTLSGSFDLNGNSSYGQLYSNSLSVQSNASTKAVSSQPANKATGVPTSLPSLSVTFSKPMQTQSAVAILQGGSDVQVGQNPTLDASQTTLTFALSNALQPNTTYQVTVTALDAASQSVTYKGSFTTGS
jgi:hypothetical protein